MRFKVPKDVDIEDRIVGPLTLKQLGWLGGGMVICIVLYKTADFQLFVVLAVLVVGLSTAFAFVRPYNQSLIAFCGSVMLFLTKPKQYLWKRIGVNFVRDKSSKKKDQGLLPLTKKGLPQDKIEQLAGTLDSSGPSA
jgi:hypothetical protein